MTEEEKNKLSDFYRTFERFVEDELDVFDGEEPTQTE